MNKLFKKSYKMFLLTSVIVTVLSVTVFGASVQENIDVAFNSVNIDIEGQKLYIDNILHDGTTYAPLRAVSEMLGKIVGWDPSTNTASINAPGDLRVHFLDVGQGDSIFIELANGENILIDGGTRSNGEIVLNYLDKHDVDTIDYLIATHPHEDHIGGLVNVINEYDIGDIYMPDVTHTTKAFENLLVAIDNNGYKINKAIAGKKLVESKDLDLNILAPEDNYKASNLNNHSIVLKLDYKDNSFIFTGDAERESENQMLSMDYDLHADVLKVGHHGSDTSTTSSFLNKVDPDYAIISCGLNNKYGHPNNNVLNRLEANDVQVFRTDLHGNIIVNSNGKTISIITNKSSKTN